jgi:hypothetical protein
MPKKPIDLEALRRIDAQLDALLDTYPELRKPNPEREAALVEWLKTLEEEETTP